MDPTTTLSASLPSGDLVVFGLASIIVVILVLAVGLGIWAKPPLRSAPIVGRRPSPRALAHSSGRIVFVEAEADRFLLDFMPDERGDGELGWLTEPVAVSLARPANVLLAAATEQVLQRWVSDERVIDADMVLGDPGPRYQLQDGETRLVLVPAVRDRSEH